MQTTGKNPIEGAEALAVLEGIDDLYVAKGRAVLHFDLTTERPTDDELLGMLLGRSGKLRAPTVRTATKLMVGYNQGLLNSTLL